MGGETGLRLDPRVAGAGVLLGWVLARAHPAELPMLWTLLGAAVVAVLLDWQFLQRVGLAPRTRARAYHWVALLAVVGVGVVNQAFAALLAVVLIGVAGLTSMGSLLHRDRDDDWENPEDPDVWHLA